MQVAYAYGPAHIPGLRTSSTWTSYLGPGATLTFPGGLPGGHVWYSAVNSPPAYTTGWTNLGEGTEDYPWPPPPEPDPFEEFKVEMELDFPPDLLDGAEVEIWIDGELVSSLDILPEDLQNATYSFAFGELDLRGKVLELKSGGQTLYSKSYEVENPGGTVDAGRVTLNPNPGPVTTPETADPDYTGATPTPPTIPGGATPGGGLPTTTLATLAPSPVTVSTVSGSGSYTAPAPATQTDPEPELTKQDVYEAVSAAIDRPGDSSPMPDLDTYETPAFPDVAHDAEIASYAASSSNLRDAWRNLMDSFTVLQARLIPPTITSPGGTAPSWVFSAGTYTVDMTPPDYAFDWLKNLCRFSYVLFGMVGTYGAIKYVFV